jgi:hypothetical protein
MCTITFKQPPNQVLLFSNDLNTLKCARLHLTTSNHVSTQITFNILKDAQIHLTNSNHHPNASNMHSSITITQSNTYNLQMCICTPTMLQSLNIQASKHHLMLQTCTNAPPTQSTPKAPPSTKTSRDPLPNQLAILTLQCI